jgi:hypothetical protein
MASGHVNRTNRPNTWLHRPSLLREDSPCQRGAVHTWHLADALHTLAHVGCQGLSRRGDLWRAARWRAAPTGHQ